MKGIRLKDGEEVQAGDVIRITTAFSVKCYPVTRVTKTMAFCQGNDVAEIKFPRYILLFTKSFLDKDGIPTKTKLSIS